MAKILLVEDDETLVFGIEFALQKEGFQVEVASTVQQARKVLECDGDSLDLIILDVNLPDGNGFELCRGIRKESDIPIIFLTACDEEVNVVLGLEIGADGYITKPFRVREFISRIKAILRRAQKATVGGAVEQQQIRSGEILWIGQKMQVYKGKTELNLTPVEYKLVSIFMQHPQQVLTREQILQRIWDLEGEFIDDNTLSVHIRRLREKIEDQPSKPHYIVTVRGVGYKWDQKGQQV